MVVFDQRRRLIIVPTQSNTLNHSISDSVASSLARHFDSETKMCHRRIFIHHRCGHEVTSTIEGCGMSVSGFTLSTVPRADLVADP